MATGSAAPERAGAGLRSRRQPGDSPKGARRNDGGEPGDPPAGAAPSWPSTTMPACCPVLQAGSGQRRTAGSGEQGSAHFHGDQPEGAKQLHISIAEPIVVIERLRLLAGTVHVTERICVQAALFPGLETHEAPNNLYDLYSRSFGVTVCRASQRLKAVAATASEARISAPARAIRSSKSTGLRFLSTGAESNGAFHAVQPTASITRRTCADISVCSLSVELFSVCRGTFLPFGLASAMVFLSVGDEKRTCKPMPSSNATASNPAMGSPSTNSTRGTIPVRRQGNHEKRHGRDRHGDPHPAGPPLRRGRAVAPRHSARHGFFREGRHDPDVSST